MPATPSALRIVEAQESDVPLIFEFIRKLAHYEKLSSEVRANEMLLRQWLFGPKRVAEVLLAFADNHPVGFALYFTTYSTFLGRPGIYLEDLFVDCDERGKGIGKALLQRLAQLTVEFGYGRLEWSVLTWNEPSIAFYRRLNARPLEEWTGYRLEGEALTKLAAGAQNL